MTLRLRTLLILLSLAACSREAPENAPTSGGGGGNELDGEFQESVFERKIVFLMSRPDSVLLVPWLLTARTSRDAVRHEARGLLGRGDTWEPFFSDAWESQSTRQPWQLLPRGRMRLLMGHDDALERILFDEGPRQLEVILEQPRAEWSGERGETFRLLDGALVLSSTRVPGLVLDLTRGRRAADAPGGDWAFLVAGDTLQVVLHSSEAEPAGTPGAFRAWARAGPDELHWTDVTATWGETRAFERARRDVPVAWSATSDDGDMRAELTVRTAQLQAGSGEGPQLPVDALFEVEGTVRLGGAAHAVRGLLRHLQP